MRNEEDAAQCSSACSVGGSGNGDSKAMDAGESSGCGERGEIRGAGDTDDSEDNTVKIEDGNSNQKQIGQKGAGTAAESK